MIRSSRVFRAMAMCLAVLFAVSSVCEAQRGGAGGRGGFGGGRGGFGGGRGGFGGGRGGFGGGPGGGRGINKVDLLGSEQVQKELKIGEDQMEIVGAALEAYQNDRRELFGGLRDLRDAEPEEQEKMRLKMAKDTKELADETMELVEVALEPDQSARLTGIYLQQLGVRALLEDTTVNSLKLSDEQVAEIKGAIESQQEEQQKLFDEIRSQFAGRFGGGRGGAGGRGGDGGRGGEGADRRGGRDAEGGRGGRGGPGGPGGMRERIEELTKKTEETAMAVLTSEQRDQFEELKGEEFELERRGFGGPGGGGRGGFGGGRDRGGDRGGRERGGDRGGRRDRPEVE